MVNNAASMLFRQFEDYRFAVSGADKNAMQLRNPFPF